MASGQMSRESVIRSSAPGDQIPVNSNVLQQQFLASSVDGRYWPYQDVQQHRVPVLMQTTSEEAYVPSKKRLKKRNSLSHRLIEKRRRDNLSRLMDKLNQELPESLFNNQKTREKAHILEAAIKYIKQLKAMIKSQQVSDQSVDWATSSNPEVTIAYDQLFTLCKAHSSIMATELVKDRHQYFQRGYQECFSQVEHFLETNKVLKEPVYLVQYLNGYRSNIGVGTVLKHMKNADGHRWNGIPSMPVRSATSQFFSHTPPRAEPTQFEWPYLNIAKPMHVGESAQHQAVHHSSGSSMSAIQSLIQKYQSPVQLSGSAFSPESGSNTSINGSAAFGEPNSAFGIHLKENIKDRFQQVMKRNISTSSSGVPSSAPSPSIGTQMATTSAVNQIEYQVPSSDSLSTNSSCFSMQSVPEIHSSSNVNPLLIDPIMSRRQTFSSEEGHPSSMLPNCFPTIPQHESSKFPGTSFHTNMNKIAFTKAPFKIPNVPIFAMHPSAKYYVPMRIEASILGFSDDSTSNGPNMGHTVDYSKRPHNSNLNPNRPPHEQATNSLMNSNNTTAIDHNEVQPVLYPLCIMIDNTFDRTISLSSVIDTVKKSVLSKFSVQDECLDLSMRSSNRFQ